MASGSIGNAFWARIYESVTVVGTTDAAGFPASNVLDWSHPSIRWQSDTLTGDKTLVFDFGASPPSYAGFYLGRVNFTSAVLQANAADVWTSPTYSVAITPTQDAFVNRKQGLHFFNADRSTIALRYARLRIPSGTGVDDSSTEYKVGVMVPIVSSIEVDNRAAIRLQVTKAVLRNELPGGGRDIVGIGVRRMRLELPWEWLWDPTVNPAVNEESMMLNLASDPDTPVVVCRNINKPEQAYLSRAEVESVVQLESNSGIGATMPLVFIEVI